MQKVPFVNLQAQYGKIKGEIQQAINAVLESTNFIMGPEVKAFESQFAEYCNARRCIGVANGTDAIFLALKALGVGPGDAIVAPANTFIATAEPAALLGAKPYFVDIDPRTYTMDPNKLEDKLGELGKSAVRVKTILAVHLFGQPCDMDAIMSLARRFDLRVIEDAAQAHGAESRGRRVGGLADVACFSFYPGKNLGAYGDAGAVVTNNEELADRIAMLRNHGRTQKYEHDVEGINSRLDTLQAAILSVKLAHLEQWTETRIANASAYWKHLSTVRGVTPPFVATGARHVYHLYVVRVKERDLVQRALAEAGIQTGIHYPLPLHLQPAYRHLGYNEGAFPESEQASKEILSLPMDAELSMDQIMYVCEALKRCMS